MQKIKTIIENLKLIFLTETGIFILAILFIFAFMYSVGDGMRVAILGYLDIPVTLIGLALWGDAFFLRILASITPMALGVFLLGTILKSKMKLAIIIIALPVTLFWVFYLSSNTSTLFQPELMSEKYGGYTFSNIKLIIFLPLILGFSLPIVSYYSFQIGQKCGINFERPKSVLNIKWYHWIWITAFYLQKAVALLTLSILSLVNQDWDSSILTRIILFSILVGLSSSVAHVYSLLAEEYSTRKRQWATGAMVVGHVLLFSIFYILYFPKALTY